MQCDDRTGGTGALALIGVYPSSCEAIAHGLPGCEDDSPMGTFAPVPRYLIASGNLAIEAVESGEAKWAGAISHMKIVEACSIPNIESAETVPKYGGRCYVIVDARWDSR